MVLSKYHVRLIKIGYEYSGCIINRHLIKNEGIYTGKMITRPCILHYPVRLHTKHSVSHNCLIISVKPIRVLGNVILL